MSFGLAGIAVLFNPLFLCGLARSGGLYFGTAGLGHIKSVKTNREEVFSMPYCRLDPCDSCPRSGAEGEH